LVRSFLNVFGARSEKEGAGPVNEGGCRARELGVQGGVRDRDEDVGAVLGEVLLEGFDARVHQPGAPRQRVVPEERDFFIDNLRVRVHFIIVMIRWTGLAP